MKSSLTLALIGALFLSMAAPALGQDTRSLFEDDLAPLRLKQLRGKPAKPQTEFGKVEVLTDGDGALIRWEMKTEVANAGFSVYRVGKGNTLVNEVMIPGSAAKIGAQPLYGETYQVFDPQGALGSAYIVRSRSMNGNTLQSRVSGSSYVDDLEGVSGRSKQALEQSALTESRSMQSSEASLSPELLDIVAAGQNPADLAMHRWVVAQPGVKISTKKTGFYRVSRANLEAAGFAVSSDPDNWKLFADGVEQSIIVGPDASYIEFYGKGMDTPESDTRTYYLMSDSTPGKRIVSRTLRRLGAAAGSRSYPVTAELKERFSYFPAVLNGDLDNHFGRILFSVPTQIPFVLNAVDTQALTADVTVNLHGFTFDDHDVSVSVNGRALPNAVGIGQNKFSLTASIPVSDLVEGSNTLELATQPGSNDLSMFDSVQVTYSRKFVADQGRISFFSQGYRNVDVSGFASAGIRVFDMTNESDPSRLANLQVADGSSGFSVRVPSSRPMVLYALEDSALLQPTSVTQNKPSTLTGQNAGTQLVVITHPNFSAVAENWADYRRQQGVTAAVVDVNDIYDEFSFGAHSSRALMNFLKHTAENWQTAPGYVLLIGDATVDPRNYEGFGSNDLVPTRIVNLIHGESGSDESLADFNGDGLAEMAIGRIPARTVASANVAFQKTKTFETPAMQSLSRGSLFAYDVPDGWDFFGMSKMLRGHLPPAMPNVYVDRAVPSAQTQLVTEMNAGKFLINYSGHGSSGKWANDSFFGIPTVNQLTNINSPTLYTMLTCLNGYFVRPDFDSIAETLIKSPNGGAVASWASTTETTPNVQETMATRFFTKFSEGDLPRLGDLIRDSKTTIPDGADVRLSWVLLGDPMLKVR